MAFSNPVVGGSGGELIRESIKSPDFVEGVSGWIIRRDGSAEFNNVSIRFDLTTGSIIVGPNTGPQVVISTVSTPWAHGDISFPTNNVNEETPAVIRATELGNLPSNRTALQLFAAEVDGTGEVAGLLINSASNDGTIESTLSGRSQFNSTSFTLDESAFTVSGEFVVTDEVLVNSNNADSNYPVRVVGGRVSGGPSTTTLVAGDTEVASSSVSVTLANDVAYKVDVQMQTRQSVGASAAGTQLFNWKLWDGAVGGTQLDATIETWNTTVGNNLGTVDFSFIFRYTGTTGAKTLRLSCNDGAGADTLQVQTNTKTSIVVYRIGDADMITNL